MIGRLSLLLFILTTSTFVFHSRAFAQDINTLKLGVVRVETIKSDEVGRKVGSQVGSGFIVKIDKDQLYIVTASHVVKGTRYPDVYLFNRPHDPLQAEVIDREDDDLKGLALLRLKASGESFSKQTAFCFGSSQNKDAENVRIIGFPDGTSFWTVDAGVISRLEGRNLVFSGNIRGGYSGGPVILGGQVIGLVTDVSQSSAYAARSEAVITYLNGLLPPPVCDETSTIVKRTINDAESKSLLSLKRIKIIHDGNKFGSGSWDFKVYIDDDQTPIFYMSEAKYGKGKNLIPEEGKVPTPVSACALKSNEFVLKVVGTRTNEGGEQATGQARIRCNQEGDILPPIPVQVTSDPKGKGSFDFYFALSGPHTNVLTPKSINPSADTDKRQDSSASNNEICATLNEWLNASKGDFYSIVGAPTNSEDTFYSTIMMPGAKGGFVLPQKRVYNYLLIDNEKSKVEIQFYMVVSKVRTCLPKWEEKKDKSSSDRFHKFRERNGTTIVVVYYSLVPQHGKYFLTLSVEIPGRETLEW